MLYDLASNYQQFSSRYNFRVLIYNLVFYKIAPLIPEEWERC